MTAAATGAQRMRRRGRGTAGGTQRRHLLAQPLQLASLVLAEDRSDDSALGAFVRVGHRRLLIEPVPPPCHCAAGRSLTQSRWSAPQARITAVRTIRRNSLITLAYDEQENKWAREPGPMA